MATSFWLSSPRFLLATLALSLASMQAHAASAVRLHPQAVVVNGAQAQASHLSVHVWLNKDLGGVGMSQYSVGDELHVGVQATQDAYIYLFNISSSGTVSLFLPSGYDAARGNFVKAGSKVTFPLAGAKYTLKVGGPLGQSRIVVLASKQPLSLGGLATVGQGFYNVNASGEQLGRALSGVLGGLSSTDWASTYTWYGVGEPGNGNEDDGSLLAESTPVTAVPTVTSTTTTPTKTMSSTPAVSIQAGELSNRTVNPVLRGAYNRTPLGVATSTAQNFDGGLWQTFRADDGSKAALFMAPAARVAYALRGPLLERYLSLSAGAGAKGSALHVPTALGWPDSDPISLSAAAGRTGSLATFQKGGLYSSALGTFWLGGELYKKYQALGGPRSALGWPTGDMIGNAAQFEGGTLRLVGSSVQVTKK